MTYLTRFLVLLAFALLLFADDITAELTNSDLNLDLYAETTLQGHDWIYEFPLKETNV